MRTIQMTLDEDLIEAVDTLVKKLKTTRSAFTRSALRDAVKMYHKRQLEEKHIKGYQKHPVKETEFNVWEQVWGD